MDLRCHKLPTSLNCKPRVAVAPNFRPRPHHGSRKVRRVFCRKAEGTDSNNDTSLGTLVKNGAVAAILGVATSALVGTPQTYASPAAHLATSAGRSKAQQYDLERIIQERNGGKAFAGLLNAKQAGKTTSSTVLKDFPHPTPLLDAAPAPSSSLLPGSPSHSLPAYTVVSAPTLRNEDPSPLPPTPTSTPPHLRSIWTPPSFGQLPLQLAAIGTSFSSDSGALAQELQTTIQPYLASLSSSLDSLRDSTTNFPTPDHLANLHLHNLGEALGPARSQVSNALTQLAGQFTLVLEKSSTVPATMALQMGSVADALGAIRSGAVQSATGAVQSASGALAGVQDEFGVLGSRFGGGVHQLAGSVQLGAADLGALSVSSLERLVGPGVMSQQVGMLASLLASGTAIGTVGLAAKTKLEAENQELISKLERLTSDYESSQAALQSRIHELQDQLASVESELAFSSHNFNTKLADTGLELTRVAEQLMTEQEAKVLMGQERDQLVRDLELARLERQQLTADAETIRLQLEEAHQQWSERECQCKALEQELAIAVSERVALRKVLQQLQHSSEHQLSAAAAMEETYSTRLGSLEKQVTELSQALASTEHALSGTEEELKEVLEVNLELHESFDEQSTKHAEQLACLESDWTGRITDMENKYIERLSDIEQEYEMRLTDTDSELKKARAELEQLSGLAASSGARLQMVEEQLAEVSAVKLELELSHSELERNYASFESETLATIQKLKQQLQEEQHQHAMLLNSTGEMQGLVAGLQGEKALLADELEALRLSTSEQLRAALADSAQMQQQNLRLEAHLASLRQECDAQLAEAEAKVSQALSAAATMKEEAERREQRALSELEVTQQQLRAAVTEGTQAAMQLEQMQQEYRALAQQALADNEQGQSKLVELGERYQVAIASLEKQLADNEHEITTRLEARFSSELASVQTAAETAQSRLEAQQAESLLLKQQVAELKASLTQSQEEAQKMATSAQQEQQIRAELEKKAQEATDAAAGLEKTYDIQLRFAERENTRLVELLEEEQNRAADLARKLEQAAQEAVPALEMVAEMETERDALKEQHERLSQAVAEQAEMNCSLKERIAELEANKADDLAATAQQLDEANQKLQITSQELQETSLQSQEQAELNASLNQRIAELEVSKEESLTATSQQLQQTNHQLEEAKRKLQATSQQLHVAVEQSEAAAKLADAEKLCNRELQAQVLELKQLLGARMEQENDSGKLQLELQQVLEEKEKVVAALDEERKSLAQAVQEEKQIKEQLVKQVSILQASNSNTLRALEDEKRRSYKAVEEESGRSRNLKAQVSELQRRLERHSKMAVTTPKGGDIRTQMNKVLALEKEKEQTQAELAAERKRAESLGQQLDDSCVAVDQLTKENQELQNEKAMNARLKRRLSELQRSWGTDVNQERMLTLLKVEQSRSEDMERAAQRAQREKKEVESRLERQVQAAKVQVDELTKQCKALEAKLKDAEKDDDEDDSGSPGGGNQLAEQLAQWKKDHQIMLELAERSCSSRIEAIKAEYEDKIEQLQQQAERESELVQVLRSEIQTQHHVADRLTLQAHSTPAVAQLHDQLQRQAREAASAQEAAYIARCKLDEECRARLAVEELMLELRQELEEAKVWEQQVMEDVEKPDHVLFGNGIGSGIVRTHRQSEGQRSDARPRWSFGLA